MRIAARLPLARMGDPIATIWAARKKDRFPDGNREAVLGYRLAAVSFIGMAGFRRMKYANVSRTNTTA
ncbi:hypothetical protein BCM02_11494 [Paenibacillus methanolicus]|uniref:Uncharacterized protein n=1 Tax=Paenibacillus methanolicus TaxID=582686 RepID=A0A5S5BTA7_9BACL|nr:hypothetical protein BCM02_11494 [Paenibacillus methanolicus]